MLSIDEACQNIIRRIIPVVATETVALAKARGRFAAAEIRAGVNNPGFDSSSMDGYAVRVADLARADFRLSLVGESKAGDAPAALTAGTCMRIFTGAPLPAGADTVVIQEDVKRDGDAVIFPRGTQLGANVRRRGEDFRRDDVLYAAGRRIDAYKLALFAAAGVAQVPVYARARVLVVATGDELVMPGETLRPGQIFESNRLATLAQLEDFGAEAIDGGTVGDDPRALRALLARSTEYDFVITSGGASVGDYDVVKQVFAEIGEIDFWKVRIKPGKPLAFGRIGERTHFFALPGNPVSSLVTYKLFVEPALAAWYHSAISAWQLPATAVNDFHRVPGRTEFLRAKLYTENGKLLAEVLKGQASHRLGPIRDTNGFIRMEADSAGFDAGAVVVVMPLFN